MSRCFLTIVAALATCLGAAGRGVAAEPSPWQPDGSSWSPPASTPLEPLRPAPANRPAYSGALASPQPAYAPNLRPRTANGGDYVPLERADAVYLDELTPPGAPEIRVAGLAETTIPPAEQMVAQPQPPLPPGARAGVFQKIYLNGTWQPVLADEPDALGIAETDFGVVFGFPMLRRDTPLLVTPQGAIHFLENADALDLPSTLYDAAVELRHLRKFGAGPWAMDVAATVGYYSDFEQDSGDAVRVSGRGIAVYESSPTTKWLFGVAYLNRAGASVIPVAGVITELRPDLKVELIFPRPRVAWRLAGSATGDERWVYLGGEFGGGVWSVTRPSTGDLDLVSYSDWRAVAGYERKITGGISRRFEAGYVFNREVEYESSTPDAALDDTLFVRAGLTY